MLLIIILTICLFSDYGLEKLLKASFHYSVVVTKTCEGYGLFWIFPGICFRKILYAGDVPCHTLYERISILRNLELDISILMGFIVVGLVSIDDQVIIHLSMERSHGRIICLHKGHHGICIISKASM